MPHTIRVGQSGNPVTYNLTQTQSFSVETVTATIDTTGATPFVESGCDVIYRDDAGLLIARSRSSLTIPQNALVTITFAPWLPDTRELGNQDVSYTNQTGLCATTLPPGGSVAVQSTDTGAVIKGFQMWVESVEDGASELAGVGRWAYVPGPGA